MGIMTPAIFTRIPPPANGRFSAVGRIHTRRGTVVFNVWRIATAKPANLATVSIENLLAHIRLSLA